MRSRDGWQRRLSAVPYKQRRLPLCISCAVELGLSSGTTLSPSCFLTRFGQPFGQRNMRDVRGSRPFDHAARLPDSMQVFGSPNVCVYCAFHCGSACQAAPVVQSPGRTSGHACMLLPSSVHQTHPQPLPQALQTPRSGSATQSACLTLTSPCHTCLLQPGRAAGRQAATGQRQPAGARAALCQRHAGVRDSGWQRRTCRRTRRVRPGLVSRWPLAALVPEALHPMLPSTASTWSATRLHLSMRTCALGSPQACEVRPGTAFSVHRTQRLQDLQLLNLRYHGTSFLCVPVVGSDKAEGSAGAARLAVESSAADSEAELGPGAASAGSATAAAATAALGCLTLGFAHDVRRHLPR